MAKPLFKWTGGKGRLLRKYTDINFFPEADQFDDALQDMLANHLLDLGKRGCLYAESNKEIGDGFWSDRFPQEQLNFLDHKYTCGHGGAVNPVTEVLIKNYGNDIPEPTNLEDFFS